MTWVTSRSQTTSGPRADDVEEAREDPPRTRLELAAITAITLAFLIFGATMIARGAPLGHDEAVYALRAEHLAGESVESAYWAPYRAPGLPALMSIPARITDGDVAMRLVPLLLAGALVVLTWTWGRAWFGPWVGVLGAGLLALTPGFSTWAWQIGVDIPGAAWGLSAVLIFLFASRGERVRPWGLLAIPFAMAAAYTRFGAPVLVGSGMTAVALAHWGAVRRSLAMTAAIATGTAAAMGAVLFVPAMTGSSVAPARAFEARQAAKDLPFWNSYADFWSIAPDVLGKRLGLLIGLGVLALAWAVARRHVPAKPALVTLGALVLFLLGLGYGLAQGFMQYLIPAVPFAAVLGAAGLVFLLRRLPPLVVALSLGVIIALTLPVGFQAAGDSASSLSNGFGILRAASSRIDAPADGSCVVLTSYSPQVGWYSDCAAKRFANRITDPPSTASEAEIREWIRIWYDNNIRTTAGDGPVYLMLAKNGKRQPGGPAAELFAAMTDGLVLEVGDASAGSLKHIVIYRFVPPA